MGFSEGGDQLNPAESIVEERLWWWSLINNEHSDTQINEDKEE